MQKKFNHSSQPVTGNISLVELTSLFYLIYTPHTHLNTELYESVPDEVALQHFEMNMNVAYVTAGDAIPATQNVAHGQVPPGTGTGTDDCYDYVI